MERLGAGAFEPGHVIRVLHAFQKFFVILDGAKLIQQVDIKDTIREIVNFNFDNALNVWTPVKKADNVNAGLTHTITLINDFFTGQALINYKPYYYMVVSYAYNNFRKFDEDNSSFTQSRPYVQGRNNTKVYARRSGTCD